MRFFSLFRSKRSTARQVEGNNSSPPLFFLHIPKTAGSSINMFLRDNYPSGQYYWTDYSNPADRERNWREANAPLCVAGHMGYGFVDRLRPGTRVFTILRDPIDRTLSSFYYFRSLPREFLQQNAPRMVATHDLTLAEFIKREPSFSQGIFGNVQTGILSWSAERFTTKSVIAGNLERGRSNLQQCMVGLAENLQQSIWNLCAEFGWPMPASMPEFNRTRNRPQQIELDVETREWLAKNTALDADLYSLGKQLFEDWTRRLEKDGCKPALASKTRREVVISFDEAIPGSGWYSREAQGDLYFCWSGAESSIRIPRLDCDAVVVSVDTLSLVPEHVSGPIRLLINEQPICLHTRPTSTGVMYEGEAKLSEHTGDLYLKFKAEKPFRPCDVFPNNQDERLLGFAIRTVRLRAA